MSGVLRTAIILVVFFFIEYEPACSRMQESSGLGDHLFAARDYYRAITEYKREAFFSGSTYGKRWAGYRIGESYRKSGRAEESLPYFMDAACFGASDGLTDSCVLCLSRSYISLRSFDAARGILDSLSGEIPEKYALAGWSYLLEGRFQRARLLFKSAERDSLAGLALACEQTRWKSPRAASIMSAVIPGAGQIYAGSYRQGITSFLLHGLIAYVAYRTIDDRRYFEAAAAVYTGFSRFYVGNIMSATHLAREYNDARMEELIGRARRDYGKDLD